LICTLSLENLQDQKIWADGAYVGEELAQWVKAQFDCVLEVVAKPKTGSGFYITAAMDR